MFLKSKKNGGLKRTLNHIKTDCFSLFYFVSRIFKKSEFSIIILQRFKNY